MSLSLDDAAEAKDEAQTGNLRESPAGVDDQFDYEENEAPDVEAHPEIMLTFGLNLRGWPKSNRIFGNSC